MKQIGVYQKKSRAYEATGCIVEEQILERFGAFPADKPEGYYCLSVKEPKVLYVTVEKTVSMEDLRGSRKYVVYLPDDLPEADPETAAAILNAYCKQTGTVRAHPADAAAALVLLDSLPPEIRRSLILTGHALPGAVCADPDAPPAKADPVCTAFLREPKIFARLPQEFASEVQFRPLTPRLFKNTLESRGLAPEPPACKCDAAPVQQGSDPAVRIGGYTLGKHEPAADRGIRSADSFRSGTRLCTSHYPRQICRT